MTSNDDRLNMFRSMISTARANHAHITLTIHHADALLDMIEDPQPREESVSDEQRAQLFLRIENPRSAEVLIGELDCHARASSSGFRTCALMAEVSMRMHDMAVIIASHARWRDFTKRLTAKSR